ncbi:MAG: hypothetical protein IT423_03700, partial [Pirellulaceae bacterium]|nr:hypothetical protein [Pirellulaceae bacterium]
MPASTITRNMRTRRRRHQQRGFLLIMVLLVVSMVSLAALNFSESMLIAHESSRLDSLRFQARNMVESGIQVARVFVAQPPLLRTEMGGAWDNAQKFQAINIVPSVDPVFRGNVTFMAPSIDQAGMINGLRYGLQNESDKLNLNALVQLDKLASTLSSAGAALGALAGDASAGGGQGGTGGQTGGQAGGQSAGAPGGQAGGQGGQGGGLTGFGSGGGAGAASSLASAAEGSTQS